MPSRQSAPGAHDIASRSERIPEPATCEPGEDDADTAWMRSACFCTSIRRIDRVLTRFYDDALRPSGLSIGQYSLLATLGRAPAAVSLSHLAEGIDLDRSTLSRNLAPLEREGLVRIEPGADRRSRFVAITDRGRAKLEVTRPLWRAAQDRVDTLTGNGRIETVLAELATLVGPVRDTQKVSDLP
ncbi:MAG: MarR family winged helix-turn-helix transcriptional regulator [Thermomicrobiales bacterium]